MDELRSKAEAMFRKLNGIGYNRLSEKDKAAYEKLQKFLSKSTAQIQQRTETQLEEKPEIQPAEMPPVESPQSQTQLQSQPQNNQIQEPQTTAADSLGQADLDSYAFMSDILNAEPVKALNRIILPNYKPNQKPQPTKDDVRTKLDPQEEAAFQQWWATNPKIQTWQKALKDKYGSEDTPDNPNYDYRGAFLAGMTPEPVEGDAVPHWGSKGVENKDLKSLDHPTRWKSDYFERFGVDPDKAGINQNDAIKELMRANPGYKNLPKTDEGSLFNEDEKKYLRETFAHKSKSTWIDLKDPQYIAKKTFIGNADAWAEEVKKLEAQLKTAESISGPEQLSNDKEARIAFAIQTDQMRQDLERARRKQAFYSDVSNFDKTKLGVQNVLGLEIKGKTGKDKIQEVTNLFLEKGREEKYRSILNKAGYSQEAIDEVFNSIKAQYQDPVLAQNERNTIRQSYPGVNADIHILGETANDLPKILDLNELKIAKINTDIRNLMEKYWNDPSNPKASQELIRLQQQLLQLQPKGARWIDMTTGQRIAKDAKDQQYAEQVNAKMQEYKNDPTVTMDNVRNMLIQTKYILNNLHRQKEAYDNSFKGDKSSSLDIDKIEQMILEKRTEYEALSRLYYLNENPVYTINESKGFGNSMREVWGSFLGKDWGLVGSDAGFHSDLMAKKSVYQRILPAVTDGSMTKYEEEAMNVSFGDMVAPGIGGAIQMAVTFAGLNKVGTIAKIVPAIQAMKMARGAGSAVKITRAMGWLSDMAYNEALFRAIGGAPGEGAIFSVAMGAVGAPVKAVDQQLSRMAGRIRGSRAPLSEKLAQMSALNEVAWQAKPLGWASNAVAIAPIATKDAIRTSISLALANNAIEMGKGLGKAMMTDGEYRYQLEKIYGTDSGEIVKRLGSELTANLVFGLWHLPERITGISKGYDKIVNKELEYYNKLYKQYDFLGLKTERDIVKGIIDFKLYSKDLWSEKNRMVKLVERKTTELNKSLSANKGQVADAMMQYAMYNTEARERQASEKEKELGLTNDDLRIFDVLRQYQTMFVPEGAKPEEQKHIFEGFWRDPMTYLKQRLGKVDAELGKINEKKLEDRTESDIILKTRLDKEKLSLEALERILINNEGESLKKVQQFNQALVDIGQKDFSLEELGKVRFQLNYEAKVREGESKWFQTGKEYILEEKGTSKRVTVLQDIGSDKVLIEQNVTGPDGKIQKKNVFVDRENLRLQTKPEAEFKETKKPVEELIQDGVKEGVVKTQAELDKESMEEGSKLNRVALSNKLLALSESTKGNIEFIKKAIEDETRELYEMPIEDQDLIGEKMKDIETLKKTLAELEKGEKPEPQKKEPKQRISLRDQEELGISPDNLDKLHSGEKKSEVFAQEKRDTEAIINEIAKELEAQANPDPDAEKAIKAAERKIKALDKAIEEQKLKELEEEKQIAAKQKAAEEKKKEESKEPKPASEVHEPKPVERKPILAPKEITVNDVQDLLDALPTTKEQPKAGESRYRYFRGVLPRDYSDPSNEYRPENFVPLFLSDKIKAYIEGNLSNLRDYSELFPGELMNMIISKVMNGETMIPMFVNKDYLESYLRLTDEQRKAFIATEMPFDQLPEKVRTALQIEIENYRNLPAVKSLGEKLENRLIEKPYENLEAFLAGVHEVLTPQELGLIEDTDMFSERGEGAVRQIEEMDRGVVGTLAKILSEKKVAHPREEMIKFFQSDNVRQAIVKTKDFEKTMNELADSFLSEGLEGAIEQSMIAKMFTGKKKLSHDFAIGLYNYFNSLNQIQMLSYMVMGKEQTGRGINGYRRMYANQKSRDTEFRETTRRWLDNLYWHLSSRPDFAEMTRMEITDANRKYLNKEAVNNLRKRLKTLYLAGSQTSIGEQADHIFGEMLHLMTGIKTEIWSTFFKKATERKYVQARHIGGEQAIPNIIQDIYKRFIENSDQEIERDPVAWIFHYFTEQSYGDNQLQVRALNSKLKQLANVASDPEHLSFYWVDKENKEKPAMEFNSYFTHVVKNIMSDRYNSDFYKNNTIVKFWRDRGSASVMKIGRIFSNDFDWKGSKEHTYDTLGEEDLRRISFFEFIDRERYNSYNHFYRVFSDKKQLYMLEVPVYSDARERWKKIVGEMDPNTRKTNWYSDPELLDRKVDALYNYYQSLWNKGSFLEFREQILRNFESRPWRNEQEILLTEDELKALPENEKMPLQADRMMQAKLKDAVRDYIFNTAINNYYADQLFIGKPDSWYKKSKPVESQNYNDLVKNITKRLGSINSSGQAPLVSDDPEWKGLRTKENHLVLSEIMLANPLSQNNNDRFEMMNGPILSMDEHMNRMAFSLGKFVTKPNTYESFDSSKDIWFDLNENGDPSLTKGNRHRLSQFINDGDPATNPAKIIFDLVTKYNEGKAYENQIHSISFGPSTTKISSHIGKSKYADKNGFLRLFNDDMSVNDVPVNALSEFVQERSNESLFYQQDLRSQIRPKEAKTPVQERNDLSVLESTKYRLRVYNQVANERIAERIDHWNSLVRMAKENKLGESLLRQHVMSIIGDQFPTVKVLLGTGISLDDPFIKRFIDTFITADFTNNFLQENMRRIALQEIPNFSGHKLLSIRELQSKDIAGDAELGIEANERNQKHALLPQFDANIEGARYGKWFSYMTADETNSYRESLKSKIGSLEGLSKEEIDAKIDALMNSKEELKKRIREGKLTRKDAYERAKKYMASFNDFHKITNQGQVLPDVNYWEIEETNRGENNQEGSFFYVPGELIKDSRVPGHDITSHPVGRLRKRVGGKKNKSNYIVAPDEITLMGGSDFDGDKRFIEVAYNEKAFRFNEEGEKETFSNPVVNIRAKDPTDRQKSQKNIALMMLANDFRHSAIIPLINERLTIDVYNDILAKYSVEKEPMDNPDGIMSIFKSQRLLGRVISHVVSAASAYDFIKYVKMEFKPLAYDTKDRKSFNVGMNVYDPIDLEYKRIRLTVNGFAQDPHHVLKKQVGIIENIALDNKDDLYRMGITEHTASAFVGLLFGDVNISEGTREQVEARVNQRIHDIVTYMHSPLIEEFVKARRAATNMGMDETEEQTLKGLEFNPRLVSIYDTKFIISPEDAAKPEYQNLSDAEKLSRVISKGNATHLNGDLKEAIDELRNLLELGHEIQSVYQLQNIGKRVPGTIEEYHKDLSLIMRFYDNSFKFIDGHSIFIGNLETTGKRDLFFGVKPDDKGEWLPHLINPTEFFQLDRLNPFVQDVARSMKMAQAYYINSLELSGNGRRVISYYARGKAERNQKKDFGSKILYEKEFGQISRGMQRALLQTAVSSGRSLVTETTYLKGRIAAYNEARKNGRLGEINSFLDKIGYVENRSRVGNAEQSSLSSLYNISIELLDAYHRTKFHEKDRKAAQDAFEMLPPDDKMLFVSYLMKRWGPIMSNWSGSYIELLPESEMKRIDDAYSQKKQEFIDMKEAEETDQESILRNVDMRLVMGNIRNVIDFTNPDLAAYNTIALSRKTIDNKFDPKTYPVERDKRLSYFDKQSELYFIANALRGTSENPISFSMPILKGTSYDFDVNTRVQLPEFIDKLFEILPVKRDVTGMDENRVRREEAFFNQVDKTIANLKMENDFRGRSAELGKHLVMQRYKVFESLTYAAQQQEIFKGKRNKTDVSVPTMLDFIRELAKDHPAEPWSPYRQMIEDAKKGEQAGKYPKNDFIRVGGKEFKVLSRRLGRKFKIETEFYNDPSSTKTGFFDPVTKKVRINTAVKILDVPFHEYLHPFYEAVVSKYPKKRAEWKVALKTLALDNPKLAKRFAEIIESYPEKDQDKEMFTYYLANMLATNYRNRTVANRIKGLLLQVIDHAFDSMGWISNKIFGTNLIDNPFKVKDFAEFQNYSIEDVVKFFEGARKVALDDWDYSGLFESRYEWPGKVREKVSRGLTMVRHPRKGREIIAESRTLTEWIKSQEELKHTEFDNTLMDAILKINRNESSAVVTEVDGEPGMFRIGSRYYDAHRGEYMPTSKLLNLEIFDYEKNYEYGKVKPRGIKETFMKRYYPGALMKQFAGEGKGVAEMAYILSQIGIDPSVAKELRDRIRAVNNPALRFNDVAMLLDTYVKDVEKHVNFDILALINSLKHSHANGFDLNASFNIAEPIFRHLSEKASAEFAQNIKTTLMEVMREHGIQNMFGQFKDVFDKEGGIVEYPSFVALRDESQGGDIFIKIITSGARYWNENGSLFSYISEFAGSGSQDVSDRVDVRVEPINQKKGSGTKGLYTSELGTKRIGKEVVKEAPLEKTKATELELQAAGIANAYEKDQGRKLGKVIFIPIQFDIDKNFLLNDFVTDFSTTKDTDRKVADIGKNWQGLPVEKMYMVKPSEQNYLVHTIDDSLRTKGKAISEIVGRQRNHEMITQNLKEVYAEMNPLNGGYHPKIGILTRESLARATAFLTRMLGKRPQDATLEDFYNKSPYFNQNVLLKLTSMGYSIDEIENKLELPELIIALASGSREEVDSNHLLKNDGSTTYTTFHGLLDTVMRYHRLGYDANGNPYYRNSYEMIEFLRRDEPLLKDLYRIVSEEPKDSFREFREFLTDAIVTYDRFKWIKKENTPGYNGPRPITLLVAHEFQNDPALYRDWNGKSDKWKKVSQFFRPTAMVNRDVMPAQFVLGYTDRIQIQAYNKAQELFRKFNELDTDKIKYNNLFVPGKITGELQLQDINELKLQFRNGQITEHELNAAKLFLELEKSYGHRNITGIESNVVKPRVAYESFLAFAWKYGVLNARTAYRVHNALRSSSLDNMIAPSEELSRMTFGTFKYKSNINWNHVAREKTPESKRLIDKLLTDYTALKERKEAIDVAKVVDDNRHTRPWNLSKKIGTSTALYAEEGNSPSSKALMEGMLSYYRGKMIEHYFSEILPHYEAVLHMYETRGINPAKAKGAKEPDTRKRLLIEDFLKRALTHDVYQESVDFLESEGWIDFFDFLMKMNAYAALSLDFHAQYYNFLMGQTWNLVMEPTMFAEHLGRMVWTTGKNVINAIPGLNLAPDDKNIIKLNKMMTNMRIGLSKQSLTDRGLTKRIKTMGEIAFKPMSFTEKVNQGVLTFGFINELRGGKDNIWQAYDNNGVVKPGMEGKALTDTEMQMLRFFIEGIQGYYGFSRGQYAYYTIGRLAGMFRFPWQIAQLNNMFGKYKIDASQMEHIGFINGAASTMWNLFKYSVLSSDKQFSERFANNRNAINLELSGYDYMINKVYGQRDRHFIQRLNRGWENTPEQRKRAITRAIALLGLATAAYLLYLKLKAELKELTMAKSVQDQDVDYNSTMYDLVDYFAENKLPGISYNKKSIAKRKMTEAQFVASQQKMMSSKFVSNYVNDILGLSVLETYKNPTAVISVIRKVMTVGNATAGMVKAWTHKDKLSKEYYDLLYVNPQMARPGFPIGSSKMLNALFQTPALWGFGGIVPEIRKHQMEFAPEKDYRKMQQYYQRFPVGGSSSGNQQLEMDFSSGYESAFSDPDFE